MKTMKLLVYADVNLNIMDGSSVWLAELLRLLSSDVRLQIDFLRKAPNQSGPLNAQVDELERLNCIEKSQRPMKTEEVVAAINELDKEQHYDRVFVRGLIELGKELIKSLSGRLAFYTLEPFQRLEELTNTDKKEIGEILNATAFAVVQSPRMKTSYSKEFNVPEANIFILPPLIPPIMENPSFRNQGNRLCYTGKFSEEWGTPGLVETFKKVQQQLPYAKLNIAGNKFHGDVGGHKEAIQCFFEQCPAVNWVGVVSRQESIQLSRNSDIGFALRSDVIDNDNSQELSTKLFEYMSAGKPVLLRPTKVHKELLGEDYPLFASTVDEAAEKAVAAFTDVQLYDVAARMSYLAYKRYAKKVDHSQIIERLLDFGKKTILFAGHDLKFLRDTIDAYEADENWNVIYDHFKGHAGHDKEQSKALIEQADVIFCEWGLGNIRWYSQHKQPGQRLVVRIHLQENRTPQYLQDGNIDNIDAFIFIAPYRYEEFVEMHNLDRSKAKLVFNTVDVAKFDKPKLPEARYTLGFIGIVPWRKRFDLALDLFAKLWKKDNRYTLRVKGKLPEDFPWMQNGNFKDELALYDALYKRIKEAPWGDNVVFDGHGNDMPEWFQKIGYIISTSDFEGSHQAVAEGMASGAVPLMLPWAGADTVYPKEFVFDDLRKMQTFVEQNHADYTTADYARKHFDDAWIVAQLRAVCEQAHSF